MTAHAAQPALGLPRRPAPYSSVPQHAATQPVVERSRPGIPAILAGIYLASVAVFSSWREDLSWIPQVIGLAAAGGWVIFGYLFRGSGVVWPSPVVLYLAWALWAATGLMITLDMAYYMVLWKSVLKVAAMTWVMSQCVRTRADLLTCLLFVSGAAFVIFNFGAESILRAASFTGMRETVGARAEATMLTNANILGKFGVAVLLASLMGLWGFRSKFFKLVSLAPIPVALYLIAASGSRMAMLGVLIVATTVYFFHLRKMGKGGIERKMAMLVLGVAVAGGGIYYVAKNPFFFRFRAVLADRSAMESESRFRYFVSGMRATAENPVLGLGLGGFSLHGLGGRGNRAHYSHSTVTETLVCTGVTGFLIYLGSQLALFNVLRRLRKAQLPRPDMAVCNMILVAFWTFLIMSVVTVAFDDRLIWPLFGAFCGYLATLKKRWLAPSRLAGGFVR